VAGRAVGYDGDPESFPPPLKQAEIAPRTRRPLSEFVLEGTFGQAAPIVQS
jgi:hypothetical protein